MNNINFSKFAEDSDLIAYECCNIIYKLKINGDAMELKLKDLDKSNDLDLSKFRKIDIIHMCLLSGCDYISNISGVGIKKAYDIIVKYKDLDKIFKYLREEYKVPDNYEWSFNRAYLTFCHQKVYDPNNQNIIYLSPVNDNNSKELEFLGTTIDDNILIQISQGNLNPKTKEPYNNLGDNSKKNQDDTEISDTVKNEISNEESKSIITNGYTKKKKTKSLQTKIFIPKTFNDNKYKSEKHMWRNE